MSTELVNSIPSTVASGTFLAQRSIPFGLQRFLSKKGINSLEELNELMKYVPRIRWRRPR